MYKGSCLCGKVQYEVTGEFGPIVLCHCSHCRKAQGGAFAANAPVAVEHFHIRSGETELKEFESMPGKVRVFCGNCGSPIISKRKSLPGVVRVRMGSVDTPVHTQPTAHIFVRSKASWFPITDDLPQHQEREPGRTV